MVTKIRWWIDRLHDQSTVTVADVGLMELHGSYIIISHM